MLLQLQNAAAVAANAILKGSLDSHVDIEGADGGHALYTAGGSLVTLFEWRGVRVEMDDGELSDAALRLRERLAGWLDSPGRAFQIVYSRDPAAARDEVGEATRPAAEQVAAQRLDMADVIEDRRRRLEAASASERVVLAAYTHPSAIAVSSRSEAAASVRGGMAGLPPLRDAQLPAKTAEEARQLHNAMADSLPGDFLAAGQEIRRLDAGEAAREIARAISPGEESAGFRARLAQRRPNGRGTRFFGMPETRAALSGDDFSALGTERLARQLLRDHASVRDGVVSIGSIAFIPFDLAVAPETLTPFSRLIEAAAGGEEPLRWRMSALLESGGWAGTAWKRMWSVFFTFLAKTHNSRIRDAFRALEEIDGAEETIVRYRACFAVWDEAGEAAKLRRAAARMRHAVERWGNARAESLAGDPVACLFGSVPGGTAPTAPSAAAALTDAIALLPLDRPCSPWKAGALAMTAGAGRLWTCDPGSPLRDSWSDLVAGRPGSGKSVLLNSMNLAALLGARGRDDPAPAIAVIDIGASSSGLVSMLRDALPPDRRGEAVSARLRNDPSCAVNIFDTPIGARIPAPLGRGFAVNFVRLLLGDGAGGGELAGLIGAAVDQAYAACADDAAPKRWHESVLDDVDAALFDTGWEPDDDSTWWEAVDWLSDVGRWEEAASAQRCAVPLLSDLAAAAASPRVADNYGEMRLSTGERAIDALRRALAEAAADWPMLARPTVFCMAQARIRVVDLQDVTSRSSEPAAVRSSALMYMLARHVCTEGYYVAPEDVAGLGLRPSQRGRLERAAKLARRAPKRLSIDEFHRAGGLPGVVDQVATDIREGRKHNVQIALASQLLSDFDRHLIDLATGAWICSASESDISLAESELKLSQASVYALRHRLTGPGPDGAPVYAALETKGGPVRQLLRHRLGARELWAFSTTAEDIALREECAALVGSVEARRALAERFPSGSARGELKRRADAASARSEAGSSIAGLAAEIAGRGR